MKKDWIIMIMYDGAAAISTGLNLLPLVMVIVAFVCHLSHVLCYNQTNFFCLCCP